MRYSVVITLYKKTGKAVENSLSHSITVADSEEGAIIKALQMESVASKVADDWRIYWKSAFEIPEYNHLNGKYDYIPDSE